MGSRGSGRGRIPFAKSTAAPRSGFVARALPQTGKSAHLSDAVKESPFFSKGFGVHPRHSIPVEVKILKLGPKRKKFADGLSVPLASDEALARFSKIHVEFPL